MTFNWSKPEMLKSLALSMYLHNQVPYHHLQNMKDPAQAQQLLREYVTVLYRHRHEAKAKRAIQSAPHAERQFIDALFKTYSSRKPRNTELANSMMANLNNPWVNDHLARMSPTQRRSLRATVTNIRTFGRDYPKPPSQKVNFTAIRKLAPRNKQKAITELVEKVLKHVETPWANTIIQTMPEDIRLEFTAALKARHAKNNRKRIDFQAIRKLPVRDRVTVFQQLVRQPWATQAIHNAPNDLRPAINSALYELQKQQNDERNLNILAALEQQRGGRLM